MQVTYTAHDDTQPPTGPPYSSRTDVVLPPMINGSFGIANETTAYNSLDSVDSAMIKDRTLGKLLLIFQHRYMVGNGFLRRTTCSALRGTLDFAVA